MILRSDTIDDEDIQRQICAIYSRGNMLIRKFYLCTTDVKVQLFKCYVMNLYGATLWSNFSDVKLTQLRVAYNNIFRAFLGLERKGTSSSFLRLNTDNFKTFLRRILYKYRKRIFNSENSVIYSVTKSHFFITRSKLYSKWNTLLHDYFK